MSNRPDLMAPNTRNYWIIWLLLMNVILWGIMSFGLLITFAATMHPLVLLFAAAFGVGAWWQSRVMLSFHADLDHTRPPRLFRRHHRHAERN